MRSVTIKGMALVVDSEGVIYRDNKPVKSYDNGNGYKTVYHCGSMHYVHRVVCLAYHPEIDGKREVNHINGDKSDNTPNNLEWCSRSENLKHSFRVLNRQHPRQQLGKSGSMHHNSKAVHQIDKVTGEIITTHGSTYEAAKAVGVHQSAITAAIFNRNRMKYCKGFKWQYA
jgi:hypothetical protein